MTIMTSELKSSHHAVGSTFPRLKDASDVDQYRLNDEQVRHYHEHGYLPNHQIMDQSMIERLRQGLEDIVYGVNTNTEELIDLAGDFKPIDRGDEVPFIYFQGSWLVDEAFHDIIFHPAITVPISQLLNTKKVVFWHDQVFYKPPLKGQNVSWHQDYSYWQRTAPRNHITAWIGLDDSRLDNGCLQVIPGSHKWGLLDTVDLVGGDMNALKEQLSPEQAAQFKPTPVEMPVGQCSFHDSLTIHGSMPNTSERPRRALILNFMGEDVRSNDGENPLMPGYPPIPQGDLVRGDLWPIVFDSNLD